VIDDAVRHAAFAMCAPGEGVAAFVAQPEVYRAVLAGRPDVTLHGLAGAPGGVRGYTTAIVEGVDTLDDPAGTLRAIAAAAPGARIVALVANAAFALAIDAFVAGTAAGGHAFTASEIGPLFARAGLVPQQIAPVYGGRVANARLPLDVSAGHVKLRVESPAALESLQIAAFVVVAVAA
jgi:hypothetical protein